MLLICISCIFLVIPFSAANRGFAIQCEGDPTTLSCMESANIKDEIIHVLWKRDSGERVIWKDQRGDKKGGTFINRSIHLNYNLSLSIDGCTPSDQGIYILCINGKPSCEVKLFVNATQQCLKKKTFAEQSIRSPAFSAVAEEADTDENNLPTESSRSNFYTRWVIFVAPCLVVLMVLLVVYASHQRKEKSKNKSHSQLFRDKQIKCETA